MFIKLLIVTLLFVALSGILLGIRILLRKNGRFPQFHVGHNKEMRKRGIKCAQATDTGCTPLNRTGSCSSRGNVASSTEK
ncbi:MAG: hypothetical protein GT597_11260 [Bacteroidales bacterium]|jgi:hypothetical protein|nr:hypothetical protein [Bacteroidales bacterium]HPV17241.1 hypothetical protein [Bacteroidales bacterium]